MIESPSDPLSGTEVWDVHTHTTLSPATFDALARFSHYEGFVRVRALGAAAPDAGCCAHIIDHRGDTVRKLQANAFDAAARVADCNRHGVTMQVISPTPMMIPDSVDSPADAAEICRILNDANAAIVAEHPARFTALGALPMRHADEAIRELERIRTLGMRGVEINSNVDGLELDDPQFFPIFEAAHAMEMAVFIHPWGGFMSPAEPRLRARMHEGRNWRPWLLAMGLETALAFDSMRCGGVHARLPELRVLYAHGGGSFPAMLGRMEHGQHARPDLFCNGTSTHAYATLRDCAIYADSLTHDPWSLQLLLHVLGAERVVMGSDYPYPLGEMDPRGVRGLHPGHMVRHLPESAEQMEQAWQHFPWIPREHSGGIRQLPVISAEDKQHILHTSAKGWLRCG